MHATWETLSGGKHRTASARPVVVHMGLYSAFRGLAHVRGAGDQDPR